MSLFSALQERIHLPALLKFLGIVCFVGALWFSHGPARIVEFIGLGLFAAGYFAGKLYQ